MIYWGLGRHSSTLSLVQIAEYVKWSCLFEIPGVLSTSIARISIAILLWRLFGVKTWFRRYLYLMTALQTIAAATLLIVWVAQCRPINALWGPTPWLYCWDPNVELTIASIFQCQFRAAPDSKLVLIKGVSSHLYRHRLHIRCFPSRHCLAPCSQDQGQAMPNRSPKFGSAVSLSHRTTTPI